MSNDEGNKPRSLREIAARAKEARAGTSSNHSASDLLGAFQVRPSGSPPSAPPGSLGGRSSQPPASVPPGQISAPPSSAPPLAPRTSAPPGSLPPPAAPASPPPATLRTPPATAAPTPLEAHPAPEVKVLPSTEPAQRSVTPILVGVGFVAVLGLGVVLLRKSEPTPTGTTFGVVTSSASVEPRPAPSPERSAPPQTTERTPAVASTDPTVVDINALGAAEPSTKVIPRASGAPPKEEKAPEVHATATATPGEPQASAPPKPMGSVGELHDEMKKRVGAIDQPEPSVDTSPGKNLDAKQEKPSNAAV
ncbi:MAG: hypothetical protein NZX77_15360, partial [Polyangiaceae bacterium]|nr:hypothetical protein [Polyangiaceae bacterium]